MFKIVVLLATISGSLALSNYDKCATGATPNNVEINWCDEAPCTFYRGDKIEANLNGPAPSSSAMVTSNVDIILAGTRTPYPLPPEVVDACQHIHPGCPVTQGEHIEYKFATVIGGVPVSGVAITMELQLKDDDNMNLFCISFPATLFDSERPDGTTSTTEATPSTETTTSENTDTTPADSTLSSTSTTPSDTTAAETTTAEDTSTTAETTTPAK